MDTHVSAPGWPRLILVVLAALVVCSCAPIASVDEIRPDLPAALVQPPTPPSLLEARHLAESSYELVESNPGQAAVESETAVRLSLESLNSRSPAIRDQATAVYNYSVGRLVEAVSHLSGSSKGQGVRVAGPDGPIRITLSNRTAGSWNPKTDKLLATDRMEIGGTYFTERERIAGVGMPLVCTGPGRTEPWAPDKHYYGVTALARISGGDCAIEICDPMLTPQTTLAGQSRPLAADLSAALALGIQNERPQKFGVSALLRTDRYMQAAKLIMPQPYRADRQPVILVHGLIDSPITWTPLYNALNANLEIRSRYQIWVYRYPSGLPYPLSASLLRQELAAVYQKYPNTPGAILIGHSMGGLLVRLQISNSGDRFCVATLGKPLDQFEVEADERTMLRNALYFESSPHVAEAIFLATPHRGAEMASGFFGRLAASLIRLPVNLVAAGPKLLSRITATQGEELIERFPNSIDTLRPESRMVKALNVLEIPPSIPYCSIMGDRGRNDGVKGSDGIVSYESAHLPGARLEWIVPSDHSVQQNPQAIADIQHILLER